MLKGKLNKSMRIWRRQEVQKWKIRKLRNRGNRWEGIKESRKNFPSCKTQISRLKDPHSVSVIDENRFTKVTSLKNVRTGVTRKILKGSRENKTSLIQKNQKPEWHQTSTVTLEARRQKNNIFEILRQHNFQSKILHPGKY